MIYEKLTKIQNELKVPKSKYNSFGKYNYRSLEDIFDAVKKPLKENKLNLTMQDEVVVLGERFYVKAIAILTDCEDGTKVEAYGYARESLDKKGMDDSQITGTASSYARKYCLNGLFLIDDTKDADTDEFHNQSSKEETIRPEAVEAIKKLAEAKGVEVKKILELYKVKKLEELTYPQFIEARGFLEAKK